MLSTDIRQSISTDINSIRPEQISLRGLKYRSNHTSAHIILAYQHVSGQISRDYHHICRYVYIYQHISTDIMLLISIHVYQVGYINVY